MPLKVEPYTRNLRPLLPESFPLFVDAELQKLSVATLNIVQVLKDLDGRIAALEAATLPRKT